MRKNDVKVLSDVAHVRKRPNMYIGATDSQKHERWTLSEDKKNIVYREIEYVPGLLKLFDEIISNSIDEALRTDFKYANRIDVVVKDGVIRVSDNGRGVSSKIDKERGKSEAELAFTHLRAGSNFDDDSFVSIGTHGLGASLVNIMSERFKVVTGDGKKRTTINSRWLERQNNISSSVVTSRSSKKGTSVEFVPDFSIFGVDHLTDELMLLMEKRVIDLSVCYPQIRFRWQNRVVKASTFKKYVSMVSDIFEIYEDENVKIAALPSGQANQMSFVNGIDVYEGGTHITLIRGEMANQLRDRLNKKFKKLKITGPDIHNKICWIVITNNIPKPKFRSQTKEFITNSPNEFGDVFAGIENGKFANKIVKNLDLIDPIVETKKLRMEAKERVEAKKKSRALKKIRVPKHIPANGDPSKTMLFIVEGDSAKGTLTSVRDPDIHGCFPLRGKPLNVYGRKPVSILKNKELSQLMSIIGLEFGKKAENINYNEIKLLCDADHDGYCIVSLLMTFFANWPELFDQGKIKVVRCPIIVARNGKQTERFYSIDAYNKARKDGTIDGSWKLEYLKGLGSLSEKEYERLVNEPVEDTIELDDESRKAIKLAFGPSAGARKEWLRA